MHNGTATEAQESSAPLPPVNYCPSDLGSITAHQTWGQLLPIRLGINYNIITSKLSLLYYYYYVDRLNQCNILYYNYFKVILPLLLLPL